MGKEEEEREKTASPLLQAPSSLSTDFLALWAQAVHLYIGGQDGTEADWPGARKVVTCVLLQYCS